MKSALIVILALAIIGVAGGSYYYFEIYQPENYAVVLISYYQKLEGIGLQPETSSLKDGTDFESAANIFEKRIGLLKSIKNDIGLVETPKRMIKFHQEFSGYIDFTVKQHEHGLKMAIFLVKAKEIKELVAGIYKADLSKEKIATIGDLQKFWSERIPETADIAETMFREEIKDFTDPSFDELNLLWKGGSLAFEIVLNRINVTNPRLLISQVGNVFTKSEQNRLEESTKKLEEFTKKLDFLLKKYSAYDILAFRDFPESSPMESSERALNFYHIITKLKEQYIEQ